MKQTSKMALLPVCLCLLLLRASAYGEQSGCGRIRALEPTRRVESEAGATEFYLLRRARRAALLRGHLRRAHPDPAQRPPAALLLQLLAPRLHHPGPQQRRHRHPGVPGDVPGDHPGAGAGAGAGAAAAPQPPARGGERRRGVIIRGGGRKQQLRAVCPRRARAPEDHQHSAGRRGGRPGRRAVLGPQRRRGHARRHRRVRHQQQRQPARPDLQAFPASGWADEERAAAEARRGRVRVVGVGVGVGAGARQRVLQHPQRLRHGAARRGHPRQPRDRAQASGPHRARPPRGGMRLLRPTAERQSEEDANGLDEALCSTKLRENVADPMKADLYTPNGGRITVLNSQKLPVLKLIQMSVNRGVMRRNAILAAHWNINAHALVYAAGGGARMQIVSSEGRRVFDGELRRGQAVVVPQSFAVLARAGREGFAWVSFQTSENAMNAPVVGKTSALRGMPADVLANAFQVSREEARRIKFGRGQEMAIFSPVSSGGRSRPRDMVDMLAATA